MIKTKILISMPLILLLCIFVPCGYGGDTIFIGLDKNTSIISLIAAPSRYEGKAVRVVGYAKLSMDSSAIYLSEDDAKYGNIANAISVDLAELGGTQPSNQWVVVEGIFVTDNKGHMGMYRGSIVSIQLLKTRVQRPMGADSIDLDSYRELNKEN